MFFKILNNSRTNHWEEDSDDVYRSWSSDISNQPYGYELKDSESYFDCALWSGESYEEGQRIYFVYVEYSTGDSFGSSSGNIEYVGAFTNKEKADKLVKLILENYGNHPDYDFSKENNKNTFEYEGQKVYTYSWKGYFEHLESVYVTSLPHVKG